MCPEYRIAAESGQIEISTTPYYHPILPLLCDTDIARVSNPHTPLPQPPFRYPQDAREQLIAREDFHERIFGKPPAGLWPSEGSVSDQALEIAMDLGFKWFATDEGVLGRTRNIGFWRDAEGYPENGADLYTPWNLQRAAREICGFFRDHYISDLVGFVYSRMGADAAAEDLHRRIRAIGNREPQGRTATISVILDGENAWEYYPENGRQFLREFYRRVQDDPEIRALTMSEAMEANSGRQCSKGFSPRSWINANFDVWIGHAEDVRAWDCCAMHAKSTKRNAATGAAAIRRATDEATARLRSLCSPPKAATGIGGTAGAWLGERRRIRRALPQASHRIYNALGEHAPDALAHPIKTRPRTWPPRAADSLSRCQGGWPREQLLRMARRRPLRHRFAQRTHARPRRRPRRISIMASAEVFYLRVDPCRGDRRHSGIPAASHAVGLARNAHHARRRKEKARGCIVEQAGVCLLHPESLLSAAYSKIIEVGMARELFDLPGRRSLLMRVALWEAGLPVEILPPTECSAGIGGRELRLENRAGAEIVMTRLFRVSANTISTPSFQK